MAADDDDYVMLTNAYIVMRLALWAGDLEYVEQIAKETQEFSSRLGIETVMLNNMSDLKRTLYAARNEFGGTKGKGGPFDAEAPEPIETPFFRGVYDRLDPVTFEMLAYLRRMDSDIPKLFIEQLARDPKNFVDGFPFLDALPIFQTEVTKLGQIRVLARWCEEPSLKEVKFNMEYILNYFNALL